jgi:hypothetical protein
MPTTSTAQAIIGLALEDLGVIRPGETVSTTVLNNCLLRLNQRMLAHSTEDLVPQTAVNATYNLQVGVSRYTLGAGGVFNSSVRAMRVRAWKAAFGIYTTGGRPLSFAEMDAAAAESVVAFQKANAEVYAAQAALVGQVRGIMAPYNQALFFTFPSPTLELVSVPLFLAADTSYPLINIGVFPAPAYAGTLELSYLTALTEFASLAGTLTLPEGWEDFLHFDLAMALLPRYGRQGFNPEVLAANAQNAKAKLVDLNRMSQAPESK